MSKELSNKQDIIDLNTDETLLYINKIEQSLTPPTADEVCKALGESIGHKVTYTPHKDKMFNTSCYMVSQYGVNGVKFGFHLPPKLITLIGRFYEGEMNK